MRECYLALAQKAAHQEAAGLSRHLAAIEAQALDLYQRTADRPPTPAAAKILRKIAREERELLAQQGKLMDAL